MPDDTPAIAAPAIPYRKFGVEIELIGLTQSRATEALTGAAINAYDAGYTHARSSRWKVVSDASLSNPNGTGTCEVVSPVMAGGASFEASIAAVREVASVLKSAGASINNSCGLHVHIDAAGLTGADIARIVERYARFEAEIDQWMPRSRRENRATYCHSMSTWRIPSGSAQRTAAAVCAAMHDRFMKVNLQSYARHGTIEFRHHSGTVDPDKIEHWVRFLQSFVHASRTGNTGGTVLENTVAALNASEAHLLEALREHPSGCTMDYLCRRACLSLNSMQASLSALRKKGHDIRWERTRSVYRLFGQRDVTHLPTTTLNVAEDRIVEALGFEDRTASWLMERTGLTLDSLRCTISSCRRKGYDITFSRRANVYRLRAYRPENARVRTHRNGGTLPASMPAPAVATSVAALDTVWTHVPIETRTFLEARAAYFAERYNAGNHQPINRLTGRPSAISGDTLDAEAARIAAMRTADERAAALAGYSLVRPDLERLVSAYMTRMDDIAVAAMRVRPEQRPSFIYNRTAHEPLRAAILERVMRDTLTTTAGWEAAIAHITALPSDERESAINVYAFRQRQELRLRVDARLSRIQRLVHIAMREPPYRRAAYVRETTNNVSVRQLALAEIERRERSAAELERAMSSPTPTLF